MDLQTKQKQLDVAMRFVDWYSEHGDALASNLLFCPVRVRSQLIKPILDFCRCHSLAFSKTELWNSHLQREILQP